MPADDGQGVGHGTLCGAEAQYCGKTPPRPSVYRTIGAPQPCFSSSAPSMSADMMGLAGSLRPNESLSSPESRTLVFFDPVASVAGTPPSNLSSTRPGFVPQDHAYRIPPNSSQVSRSSVILQHNYTPEHGISAAERSYSFSPMVMRGNSPDSSPAVTFARHPSPITSVGRLRSSPTLSVASSISTSVSPSVPTTSIVPSIYTSLPSSSLSSSLSFSFPSVTRTPYVHHSHSPSTTRIVRSTSAASSTLHPSPTSRSASLALRISEASSNLEHLANSNTGTPGSSLSEREARVHNLALTYLTSHDSVPPCLHSPPPSYDQLCNPNALPTYQEATQSSRQKGEPRTVFTLPSNAEPPGTTDPVLQTYVVQESERGLRGGVLASIAAELSDSEGGYSTILDAIPHEHAREPCPAVPVRFLRTCSLKRLRPPKVQPPCLTSVCNKALVRKELNRRWPFIAGAQEDDHCPGLILVECSSHLTVAHLPELPRPIDGASAPAGPGGNTSFNVNVGGGNGADTFTDIAMGSSAGNTGVTTTIDLDAAALTSQVLFYLCGKCVGYDSFDKDNVRSHIEYDCPYSYNQWGNISERYLLLRAFFFVIIVMIVFVWLPYLGI
ncbi:uncharacterized protein [Macrobrachium rosenbergii]|uniref:uncharacterized protein n=1 Tax=Macrobrachium rosenbergii TaxID=79674 RepID=UPI0034D6F338